MTFAIRTLVRGDDSRDYHELTRSAGDDCAACVRVRYHYGREPGESPYDFRHGYYSMGDFIEFISVEELRNREQQAIEHDQEYELPATCEVWSGENGGFRKACAQIQREFEAIMVLDLFKLPITI